MIDPKEKEAALLETLDTMIDEVKEYYDRFWEQAHKFRTTERNSEEYSDAFAQMSVEAFVLRLKAKAVCEVTDLIIDLNLEQ